MISEWYELKYLTGVGGLPTTVQGITKKAKLENWQRRRVAGVKGNVFEYNVRSMPASVQQALGFEIVHPSTPSDVDAIIRTPEGESVGVALKQHREAKDGDEMVVSRARLLTAISTLEEILEIMHKTMKPEAKAQMVLMIYELLSEESANEKIVEMMRLVA